jgi:hypothetical protein
MDLVVPLSSRRWSDRFWANLRQPELPRQRGSQKQIAMMRMTTFQPRWCVPELEAVVAFNGPAAESLDVGLPCHPAPSGRSFQLPESRVIGFKSKDVSACALEVVLARSILVQFVHAAPNHLMKVQEGCLRLTVEQVDLPHFR